MPIGKVSLPAPEGTVLAYNKGMKNAPAMPDLSRLSDEQLENLEDFCNRKHRDDLWDEVIAEILRRPDFVASTHDLEYTIECWR